MSDTPDSGHRQIVRQRTNELALVSSAIVTRGLRDIARIEEPKEFTNSIDMRFKPIPAGEFMMGSGDADMQTYLKPYEIVVTITGRPSEMFKDEQPQHRVKITQPFFMAIHEVTQAQYQQVLDCNPSHFAKTGGGRGNVLGLDTSRFPVERVSWFDAVEFCVTLGDKENRSPCYRLTNIQRDEDQSIGSAEVALLTGDGYRLPTEAEWEYACRAGSTTPFHFGSRLNGDEANVDGNKPFGTTTKGPYLGRTTTVGSYKANAFGLYDMHGNVMEWCQDWYGAKYYSKLVEHDPIGRSTGSRRVNRGGGWNFQADLTRSGNRFRLSPGLRHDSLGFRVVVPSSVR